jgi:hypothetical protein
MAAPPVEQRGTGDRGTTAPGTGSGAAKTGGAPADTPKAKPSKQAPSPTPAPIGSCYEYITVNPEKSDTRTGTGIHRVVREQVGAHVSAQGYGPPLKIRLPDASFSHYRDKNSVTSSYGDVDLAFRSRAGSVMLVAEVKPANWEAPIGETQLANYIDKANANEEIKKQWGVLVFSPMRPLDATLPPEVIYQSRRFEIRWCGPGMILYKEIDKKKEEEEDKKKKNNEGAKPKSWAEQVKVIGSAPRTLEFQSWVPEALRRDIQVNTLSDGLYRNRYQAAWPSGYTSNVVLWVKTGPFGREYQYYQDFPSQPEFYQHLAAKNGLSDWQRELVRSTLVQYNDNLFSLLSPDSRTGAPSSMSPYYARDELRTIYAEVLKGVVGGSALIVTSGAAITSIANAMRQRATGGKGVEGRSIGKEDTPGTKEQPLPDWVMKAVEKGFEAARQRQRAGIAP